MQAKTSFKLDAKVSFGLIALLICCIPAVVFLLFRDKSDSLGSYSKPIISTSWPVEKAGLDYNASLSPENTPLKRGKQVFHLTLKPFQDKSLKDLPIVKITMPMGSNTMEAPVQVKKDKAPYEYQVETEFSMAGPWEADVQPTASANPISLNFNVDL